MDLQRLSPFLEAISMSEEAAYLVGSIFLLIFLSIVGCLLLLKRVKSGSFLELALPVENEEKRAFELFSLKYSVVWILAFGTIVALDLYESFDEWTYFIFCTSLSLPFLLYPFVERSSVPLLSRYSMRANLWIAIFSFIGNYWYTHYFYSVLKADYSFPSWRLNNVPIPLFFATHFYFLTYHTFSNLLLRYIQKAYDVKSSLTFLFSWIVIFSFAYFTAFMETATIAGFPYYYFENRDMAYSAGSAFYGIYFIVSFPMFFRVDEESLGLFKKDGKDFSLFQTFYEVMGSSMFVLCLLDFVRVYLGVEYVMKIASA